jgi:hypothetical protein
MRRRCEHATDYSRLCDGFGKSVYALERERCERNEGEHLIAVLRQPFPHCFVLQGLVGVSAQLGPWEGLRCIRCP